MAYPPIAGNATETFLPTNDLSGASPVITQSATVASGNNVVYLQVLGRVTASSKLVAHAPGASDGSQIAVALAAYAVDASAADVVAEVITGGEFTTQSVVFNVATNTDALKAAVFPLGSEIVLKKRAFGAV